MSARRICAPMGQFARSVHASVVAHKSPYAYNRVLVAQLRRMGMTFGKYKKKEVCDIVDLKYLKWVRPFIRNQKLWWEVGVQIDRLEAHNKKLDAHRKETLKFNFLVEFKVPVPNGPPALTDLVAFVASETTTPEEVIEQSEAFLMENPCKLNGIRIRGEVASNPVVKKRLLDFLKALIRPRCTWFTFNPSQWDSDALNFFKIINVTNVKNLTVLSIHMPPNVSEEELEKLADTIPHVPEVNGPVFIRGCDMKTFEAIFRKPAITFRAQSLLLERPSINSTPESCDPSVVKTLSTVLRRPCKVTTSEKFIEFTGI